MVTAAIGAGLALASAIYGGIQSASANNKARKLIQQQRDANKRWYDIAMSQDYTMRTDAQATIKRLKELYDEQSKSAMRRGVVAGATPEAVAMQKEAVNKAISDTMTGMAENESARKDSIEREYRAQDAALNQQQFQSHQQQAAQTAQAASQAVNAGIGLAGNAIAMQGATNSHPSSGVTLPKNLNEAGELTAPVQTDLTSVGNAQLGITPEGLPVPKPIGKINS